MNPRPFGFGPGFGARKAFNPTDVENQILDLNPDLGITLVSSKVSAWADQSGHQSDATQATAGNRPTMGASLNGHATVAFVSGQFLAHGLQLSPPCTIVAVAKTISALGDYAGIATFTGGVSGPLLYAHSSGSQTWGLYLNANADSGQALTSHKCCIAVIRAFNDIDLYTNGVKVTVVTGVSAYAVAAVIGAGNGSGTQNLAGEIGRLMAYSSAISDHNAKRINADMVERYAL